MNTVHRLKQITLPALFALVATLPLTSSAQVMMPPLGEEQTPSPSAQNLDGLEAADAYANQLLKDAGTATTTNQQVYTVFHVGDSIPDELGWIIKKIERSGHKIQIKKITEADALEDLEADATASQKWISRLSYLDEEVAASAQQEQAGIFKRAKLRVRQLFGIPKGFTYWFSIKKSSADRARDLKFAGVQALLAGASVTATFYLKAQTGADVSFIAPGLALGLWHGINMYYIQNVMALFGQGRAIKRTNDDQWVLGQNAALSRLLNFVRAAITNVIVMGAAFGAESFVNESAPAMWGITFANATATVFSRFWIDEFFQSKQPKLLPDGTMVTGEGRWSAKKLSVSRNIFEFVNGLLKNFNLVKIPIIQHVFPASGVYGLLRAVYQNRRDYPARVRQFFLGAKNKTTCSTLLVKE